MQVFWEYIRADFIPILCALIAQCVFFIPSLGITTWRSNVLNALTYAAIQTFLAGLMFIFLPYVFGVLDLSVTLSIFVLISVFMMSCWRLLLSTPLEATEAVSPQVIAPSQISFDSFHIPERLSQKTDDPSQEISEIQRHTALREMLIRRRIAVTQAESEEI